MGDCCFSCPTWCFSPRLFSRSGKREDVIEFMQVAGFAYGIAIVFSFRIESSKCPLKKMFIGSKKAFGSHLRRFSSFQKTPTGGSSWERRGKWHGGWYLDSKRLPFPVDQLAASLSLKISGRFFANCSKAVPNCQRIAKEMGSLLGFELIWKCKHSPSPFRHRGFWWKYCWWKKSCTSW